jgi:hypothetical protein
VAEVTPATAVGRELSPSLEPDALAVSGAAVSDSVAIAMVRAVAKKRRAFLGEDDVNTPTVYLDRVSSSQDLRVFELTCRITSA